MEPADLAILSSLMKAIFAPEKRKIPIFSQQHKGKPAAAKIRQPPINSISIEE
jgi:hypothetical protein